LPTQIFEAFYQQGQPEKGLKLISYLFFDPAQRSHPHSHLFRASVINEYPLLLAAYNTKKDSRLRSQLIQKLYSAALIARSPEVKTAALDTALHLLNQADTIERQRKQYALDAQFELISHKMKAELAGHATAGSAEFFRPKSQATPHKHLLSNQDISTLTAIINLLLEDMSPEVKERAHTVWATSKNLNLTFTG
jgi:hypothetical protein